MIKFRFQRTDKENAKSENNKISTKKELNSNKKDGKPPKGVKKEYLDCIRAVVVSFNKKKNKYFHFSFLSQKLIETSSSNFRTILTAFSIFFTGIISTITNQLGASAMSRTTSTCLG